MIGKRLVNTGGAVAAFDPLQNFETVTYTGNGGTQKITGYVRKGAAFNGSSSEIDLGNSAVFSSTNTGELSISLWINTTDSDAGYILAKGDDSQVKYEHNLYLNTNGTLRAQIYNSSAGLAATVTTTATVNDGNWHHVVLVIDNGTSLKIYVDNGTPVTSTGWSGTVIYQSTVPFLLGAFEGITASSSKLNGKLDQVRIFDKALSSGEVTTLYGETYASSTKSTTDIFNDGSGVALYQLDEDANDTNASSTPIDSGQSGVFNGTSSYISLSNTAFHYTTLSISAWIKVDSFSSSNQIIQNYESGGSPPNSGFLFGTSTDGKVTFAGYSSAIAGRVDSTTILSTGIWYHVAAVITPSSWKIYVNGNDVSTNVTTNTIAYNSTTPCSIGRLDYTGGSASYFDGQIDDLRIYNDALTPTEVGYLADDDDANIPTGNLQAYYKLDGNANDTQGNYNGTANNVTYSDTAAIETGYNGTPTNVNFLGMAFAPNLVWVKSRSHATFHILQDSVRGAGSGQSLYSNSNVSEGTYDADGYISSLDTNGFTVAGGVQTNGGSRTYVAWCWRASNTTTTISAGTVGNTIASDVRANKAAGFSIVTWTGDGNDATVAHGLSSQPELVITKGRANLATYNNWTTYHKDLSTNHHLYLNTADSEQNGIGDYFRDAAFSNTVIGLGNDIYGPNVNGTTMVAYCFHSVDFYQRIGSYTGDGGTNKRIYTDSNGDGTGTGAFAPRWIMIKRTDTPGYSWVIQDTTRGVDVFLQANLSDIEGSAASIDIIQINTDGFTHKSANYHNVLNGTYIYLAIA